MTNAFVVKEARQKWKFHVETLLRNSKEESQQESLIFPEPLLQEENLSIQSPFSHLEISSHFFE